MRKTLHWAACAVITLFLLPSCTRQYEVASYDVIPLPQQIEIQPGVGFTLSEGTPVYYEKGNQKQERNAYFLSEYISQSTGYVLDVKAYAKNELPTQGIVLALTSVDGQKAESYHLTVDEERVLIEGNTEAGVFYGIQTLRKSIAPLAKDKDVHLPAVRIYDAPRFEYRGMMLDVARHFFPVCFIKRYIDLLALHNINTFHWHLTDDQGWRIEIKKYPKLTEIGSMRNKTVIGRNSGQYDSIPYGGYYTQEEAREIVKYARERYIDVIPEVDMPGHMLAALAAYPELGCTGGPYEVCPEWGVFPDVLCIGNEKTMEFLEGVMDEITDIFPSKYIHIGGDEVPRERWRECSKCQQRIRKEHLVSDRNHSAEDYLQSYCMERMTDYLQRKGRKVIGWDEILEGDIAEGVTVMSWRGMAGGNQAAQMGHDVIMVPNNYTYFDYYQSSDVDNEPMAIGGLLPVERVYSLEPVDTTLTVEHRQHIIGVQANLWTEYIAEEGKVEYQVLPRMAALCEVQWCNPQAKNYENFCLRLPRLLAFYDRDSLNYATHVFDVKASYIPKREKKGIEATLFTIDQSPIYYTLDGTEPTQSSMRYEGPLIISETALLKARAFRSSVPTKILSQAFAFNKATLKQIELAFPPSSAYTFGGADVLVNGIQGEDGYTNGAWLGFSANDLVATIDLGVPMEISRVSTRSITQITAYIQSASGLKVEISDDKERFRQLSYEKFAQQIDGGTHCILTHTTNFPKTTARYVRVTVERAPAFPQWHPGAGTRPFLFVDEIQVE